MENEIILRWSAEDNAYIAEFPALPGCMADGATVAEVLQSLECIKQEWWETAEEQLTKGE